MRPAPMEAALHNVRPPVQSAALEHYSCAIDFLQLCRRLLDDNAIEYFARTVYCTLNVITSQILR